MPMKVNSREKPKMRSHGGGRKGVRRSRTGNGGVGQERGREGGTGIESSKGFLSRHRVQKAPGNKRGKKE